MRTVRRLNRRVHTFRLLAAHLKRKHTNNIRGFVPMSSYSAKLHK